ncbi:MAG TPA: cytochrome c family protein [Devosia sp.]|nr:cytochrome c family protein [Devosia sp.]
MSAFEINKIVGAILGALLLVMGVGFIADAIYAPIKDRGVGYALPEGKNAEDAGEEVAEVEAVPLAVLLASASADNGARVARKCQSCHNFEAGEGNKTGPALYGTVGAPIAAHADFGYSDVLLEMNAAGQTWTYEALNEFLISPKAFAPGTKMSFAGLGKDQDRVDLLAYMQTLSDSPVPFPTVEVAQAAPAAEEAVTAAEEAAPAAEEAAPAAEEAAPAAEEAAPAAEEAAPAAEEAAPAAEEAAPVAAVEPTLGELLAAADADKGARVARKCSACHGFNEGDGNKVGPPLYDIIGRNLGEIQDFRYSDALVEMGAAGETWTYENMNAFLIKPRDFIPGTKMSFAGLRKEEDRVNLMAYMQTLSADPVAFPE